MAKKLPLAACALWLCAAAWPQAGGGFSLGVSPSLDIPVGVTVPDTDIAMYGLGYGVTVRGEYPLPFARSLSAGLALDAGIEPLNSAETSLSLIGGGPEIALHLSPLQRLGIRLGARGGMYAAFLKDADSFSRAYVAASLDATWRLTPSFDIGLGASYKTFAPFGEVYSGVGASLTAKYSFGSGKTLLKMDSQVNPIFPLFYSYYDKNPLGKIELANGGTGEMTDLSVSFYVPQFMEQPKESWTAKSLAAGHSAEAPIYALFKDTIFAVTEGTKVAGEIQVSFKYLGQEIKEKRPVTVVVNNRNGMTWDDTRKAAAFVTSMDTTVRSFALPVAAMSRTSGNLAVNAAFRAAVALFDALKVHGVGYVSDPVAPFETKSTNKEAVDFLQFPVQTLAFRGGDCDDLSIVYAALLESSGVATAFITVPGHIYVAFDLGMGAEEAKGYFKDPKTYIVRDGEAWLPVEVTRVQDGFVRAYQTGAQEWRSAEPAGTAGFYPIREAWRQYAPANTGEIVKTPPSFPSDSNVSAAYKAEMQRFFIAEFQPRIDALKADMAKRKKVEELARLQNRLGVLYARFGMMDEAQRQFEAIAGAKGDAVPRTISVAALINLGNIAYLKSDYEKAFGFYGRALSFQADNATALLGYARASFELGKKTEANSAIQGLRKVAPAEADRYAYIANDGSPSGRAASAEKEVSTWSDED